MLKIYEILDRYEILFPDNENLSNLRRSYLDKDLSSIFKLINQATFKYSEVELRHNIQQLRKLILEDNVWALWEFLFEYTDTQFTHALKSFFIKEIDYSNDCFSRGQLQSKLWLISELKRTELNLGTVFLCAGWYATLSVMLFENKFKIDKVRSFDIDESCISIAETFNKPWFMDSWKFKSICDDINNINFTEHTWQAWSNANQRMSRPITDIPNTIINTSCEHINDFEKWYSKIPKGKLVVIQNNNFKEIKDHVNCVNNLTEFENQSPMTTLLFEGELDLTKYTRFMRIGIR